MPELMVTPELNPNVAPAPPGPLPAAPKADPVPASAEAAPEPAVADFGALLRAELDTLAHAVRGGEPAATARAMTEAQGGAGLPLDGNVLPLPPAGPDAMASAGTSNVAAVPGTLAPAGDAGSSALASPVPRQPGASAASPTQPAASAAASAAGPAAPAGQTAVGEAQTVSEATAGEVAPSRADAPQAAAVAAPELGLGQATPARAQAVPVSQVPDAPGSPRFGEGLGDRVMWMVDRQHQVAELRLNPPELGRLDVRISMSGSEASVQFSAHSGAVREAVEQALPRLREMLEQNGLSLAHADVSDHGPREGEREQGETRPMPRAGLDTSPEAEPDGPAVALRMHEGLLDRYA